MSKSAFLEERENKILTWFDMWLKKDCSGIERLFAGDIVYVESYGPEYRGIQKIRHWFWEYNTRRAVLEWEIKQYFHRGNQTAVEWRFTDRSHGGDTGSFDGMTLIEWTDDHKIKFLKEFACDTNNYDPYRDGEKPVFQNTDKQMEK